MQRRMGGMLALELISAIFASANTDIWSEVQGVVRSTPPNNPIAAQGRFIWHEVGCAAT